MAKGPKKIKQLEELARDTVGDGTAPDLYFVTDRGTVVTVTRSLVLAYRHFRELARRDFPRLACALENRTYGVLASLDTDEERGPGLYLIDDVPGYAKGRGISLEV